MVATLRSRSTMLLTCVLLLSPASAIHAAQKTYNGIVLPDDWPPRPAAFTREPMAVPYLEKRPEVVPIDVGRQLFVDDFLIEDTTLKRVFHTATLHPAGPVLRPEKPWEIGSGDAKPSAMVFSDGVWYDPTERLFKAWYMAGFCTGTCYATSPDGIRWTKPALDVVPGTNMVLKLSRDSNTVWLDLNERDAAKRYKMLVMTQRRDEKNGADMNLRYSPDGVHWSEPVATQWCRGDRSTFFHNPFRAKWVHSVRMDDEKVGRARLYLECDDLAAGLANLESEGRIWTCADRLDPHNPNAALKDIEPQLYNLDATAYESLMVGLFSVWQGDPGKPHDKRNEILLGFSRDGFHWHRPDRRPFVGVNETDGAWNWGNVQSAGGGCLVVGDQLYFYVSGRGQSRPVDPAVTGLAVLRRDGFASMEAGDQAGTLTTRPLTFSGNYLFVNADARGGELRVEVLDRGGEPYPALTKKFCTPITTDGTIQPVRWMLPADLSALAGKPVRFRFHLRSAKLYAFWVSQEATGASGGYVAAGGPGFTETRDTVGLAAYAAAETVQAPMKPGAGAAEGWQCLVSHAPFSPRDTAENAVFAGKMWISNGWTPRFGTADASLARDLWCSSDGIQWKKVSDATPYDPYSEMVVFKDRLWAIKGSTWNSADGLEWKKVSDKTPFGGRGYGETVVFKDRIVQLGSGTDAWASEDGENWTCLTEQAPYGDRASTAVAVFDGRLWLMAGKIEAENSPPEGGYKQFTSYNDVWCSTDGANWTRVLEHAPWAPRMWSVAEAYAGRLWLIGGYDNRHHCNLGDVWTTTDGKNWQPFESPVRFAPRHEVTPYVFDGSLWVVAGNTWPVVNDVWRLTLPAGSAAAPRN